MTTTSDAAISSWSRARFSFLPRSHGELRRVPVVAGVVEALAVLGPRHRSPARFAAERLDLAHGRPLVAKDHRRTRTGDVVRRFEDLNAFERTDAWAHELLLLVKTPTVAVWRCPRAPQSSQPRSVSIVRIGSGPTGRTLRIVTPASW